MPELTAKFGWEGLPVGSLSNAPHRAERNAILLTGIVSSLFLGLLAGISWSEGRGPLSVALPLLTIPLLLVVLQLVIPRITEAPVTFSLNKDGLGVGQKGAGSEPKRIVPWSDVLEMVELRASGGSRYRIIYRARGTLTGEGEVEIDKDIADRTEVRHG